MMLSREPGDRAYEIAGLTPQEVDMYDLAWDHYKECLGFEGLCVLWYRNISVHIRLKNVWVVFRRLNDYMYFDTDPYYSMAESNEPINDYIPGIYMKRGKRK